MTAWPRSRTLSPFALLRCPRARDDNPALGVEGPDRGARKAKQFLFPSEFLQFVASPDVPLEARRAVAIAIYTYLRAASSGPFGGTGATSTSSMAS